MMTMPWDPVSVFLSSLDEDEPLLRRLETHLSVLKREGVISTWSNRQIVAGTDRSWQIDQRLEQASLILLLVSADFLASDYCYEREMQRALQRHEAGQALLIPIIIRPCDWKHAPFAHMQVLPTTAKAITMWENLDAAWDDVVQGIRKALEAFSRDAGKKDTSTPKEQQPIRAQQWSARSTPFPPVWNVPYRYPASLTGRDQVIERLFKGFAAESVSGSIPAQALTGLGGLGKTQTAVAYAYRYRKQYQTVLWIRAETEVELVTGFTHMAELLGLSHTGLHQRERVLENIQRWLGDTTDWLLILDNADNLALVEPFLPKFASGHLLLTSRAAALGQAAHPLSLTQLSPDDGALCILRRANLIPWTGQLCDAPSGVSVKAAQELSQLMGGLPLALEQAGAYIETTGRSVGGYLELYKKYRLEILEHYYGDVRSYREAVAFAWNIARESVEKEHPAAIELLSLCAFLAPDAIPYQLFPKDPRILGPTLGPVAAHPLRLDQAITLLRRHSLIQNEADRGTDISRIFIHRVLQEVLRDGMDPKTQRKWAERAVRVVALALPEVEWSIMQAHVRSCLSLIGQWNMTIRSADTIRQRALAERI
jgi:hypothetical protein